MVGRGNSFLRPKKNYPMLVGVWRNDSFENRNSLNLESSKMAVTKAIKSRQRSPGRMT